MTVRLAEVQLSPLYCCILYDVSDFEQKKTNCYYASGHEICYSRKAVNKMNSYWVNVLGALSSACTRQLPFPVLYLCNHKQIVWIFTIHILDDMSKIRFLGPCSIHLSSRNERLTTLTMSIGGCTTAHIITIFGFFADLTKCGLQARCLTILPNLLHVSCIQWIKSSVAAKGMRLSERGYMRGRVRR